MTSALFDSTTRGNTSTVSDWWQQQFHSSLNKALGAAIAVFEGNHATVYVLEVDGIQLLLTCDSQGIKIVEASETELQHLQTMVENHYMKQLRPQKVA